MVTQPQFLEQLRRIAEQAPLPTFPLDPDSYQSQSLWTSDLFDYISEYHPPKATLKLAHALLDVLGLRRRRTLFALKLRARFADEVLKRDLVAPALRMLPKVPKKYLNQRIVSLSIYYRLFQKGKLQTAVRLVRRYHPWRMDYLGSRFADWAVRFGNPDAALPQLRLLEKEDQYPDSTPRGALYRACEWLQAFLTIGSAEDAAARWDIIHEQAHPIKIFDLCALSCIVRGFRDLGDMVRARQTADYVYRYALRHLDPEYLYFELPWVSRGLQLGGMGRKLPFVLRRLEARADRSRNIKTRLGIYASIVTEMTQWRTSYRKSAARLLDKIHATIRLGALDDYTVMGRIWDIIGVLADRKQPERALALVADLERPWLGSYLAMGDVLEALALDGQHERVDAILDAETKTLMAVLAGEQTAPETPRQLVDDFSYIVLRFGRVDETLQAYAAVGFPCLEKGADLDLIKALAERERWDDVLRIVSTFDLGRLLNAVIGLSVSLEGQQPDLGRAVLQACLEAVAERDPNWAKVAGCFAG